MADPPPVLTLLVQKGPCKGETRRGRAGAALRVGRVAKGNDLAVRDAGASQSHLSVEFLAPPAARWAVTDLKSSNGTLLNDAPLMPTAPALLSDGDLIKIGESTVLAVSISAGEGPRPPPAATRRSARNAAAVAAEEEEQGPAVTRRAGRKKAAAAEAPEAEKEEAAVPTRRGGRKKATEPPDSEKEVEETAVPTRRGGRKKAAEPPEVETEEEEEEAAVPRRGRTRKAAATAALPPQPQSTRSTRAAARRGDAVGSGNDEGKVEGTGRGPGRVTRASARKATHAVPEEDEEEGEVPVIRDQVGNPPRATGPKGGEEKDTVETRDGTSNTSEEVPVAGRRRGGRRKATRASTRKVDDAIIEEDAEEQEESDVADGRECRGSPRRVMAANDGGEEDSVPTGDGKLDRTSKACMEDVEEDAPLAPKGQTGRAIEGRVNAQHATANNDGMEEREGKDSSRRGENEVDRELRERMLPESKVDGVVEEEETDKREAIGGSGEEGLVEERTGISSLENMTLGEWFVRIEKYLLAKNEEAAEKAIAEVREKHQHFCEHLKTLEKSSDPS
ncbi:ABC transporter F family member 4-like [Panicum miliaceum]|uniref:ABC transporter F family member 4-like n=1 Tax=Panicum miliaceum TaxID=4540 RepID=A0A3L6TV22_PANMI|nr:ABC transporter F family member 4-like [Panicum miliaceum]